jgi:ABC-type dipeptide/oligopeptide/nickel transport system ATPase subunit
MEQWNNLWTAYDKADCNWLKNDSWKSDYGVRMTVKKGSTWNVSGKSTLSSLTIEKGGMVNGKIQVDGKPIKPSAGKTYTGKIVVTPL